MATDRNYAQRAFGSDLAEAFLSLVADMRNAMYLGELLETPIILRNEPLLLQYPLISAFALEIQPIGSGNIDENSWSTVHRVKLIHVVEKG